MLKKALTAAAVLSLTAAPISAYAAGPALTRTALPVKDSSKGGKRALLYVAVAGAVGAAIILASDGSDSP
jgi:hypothetical protein